MTGAKQQAAGSGRVGPISAVVCNFNGEKYLHGCLDALLADCLLYTSDAADE